VGRVVRPGRSGPHAGAWHRRSGGAGSSGPRRYRHGGSGSVGPKRTPGTAPSGGWCQASRPVQAAVGCRRCGRWGCRWGGVAVSRPSDRRTSRQPPHGRPDDGPGTTTPGWPGRSGRHAASGADDGPQPAQRLPTAGEHPAAVAPGQGGPWAGWITRLVRPTSSGWVGHPPAPEGAGPARPAAALPALPSRWDRRRPVADRRWVGGYRLLLAAGVEAGVQCLAAGVVGGVVVLVTPMTADQDAGQRPITGQPPTRRRRQHSRPAGLTPHPHRPRAANQAVQVDGHRS
jgi:hypothetical protein